MSLSAHARQLGLGKIALALWHQPLARIRDSLRHGGPWVVRETERQRLEMEKAAALLPALPAPLNAPCVTLHLLSGRRFWYQTAFCLHSFSQHSGVRINAEVFDDGTIDGALRERFEKLGPGIHIHPTSSIRDRLDALLPEAKFPVLRERWKNYPNIRKLTDPHLGSTGWKLVIDSDLLFFRRPGFILDWLAAPNRPLHAIDCTESYGYSRQLMERLAGAPIPPLVNVGLCGLRSESLDWLELEAWCTELIAQEKTSYYLEQALVAMLVARTPSCAVAPAADYLTNPGEDETRSPRAVMHHYVDTSKRWYFRHGWRRVAEKSPS